MGKIVLPQTPGERAVSPHAENDEIKTLAARARKFLRKEQEKEPGEVVSALIAPSIVLSRIPATPSLPVTVARPVITALRETSRNATAHAAEAPVMPLKDAVSAVPVAALPPREIPTEVSTAQPYVAGSDPLKKRSEPVRSDVNVLQNASPWVAVKTADNHDVLTPKRGLQAAATLKVETTPQVRVSDISPPDKSEMTWHFKSWGSEAKHSAKLIFTDATASAEKINVIPSDDVVRNALLSQHSREPLHNVTIDHAVVNERDTDEHEQRQPQHDNEDEA
nr:hypothetical protein [uncultured Enterobacter sp.]